MRLTVAVIRVLPKDDDTGVGIGSEMQGGEHLRFGRENGVAGPLARYEPL